MPTPARSPESRIVRLDALLQARRSDHQLYCATVPHLPSHTIAAYSRLLPRGFARVLLALGEHITGALPFELCDELARFYALVFRVAPNPSHRRLALASLLALGPPHTAATRSRMSCGGSCGRCAAPPTSRSRSACSTTVPTLTGMPTPTPSADRFTRVLLQCLCTPTGVAHESGADAEISPGARLPRWRLPRRSVPTPPGI